MKKICVICEICVTKKIPQKDLCKSVKSVGHIPILWDIFHSQGVSATTEQVASVKIRE